MNDYKELIDISRDVDFVDSCAHCFLPCSGSGNCFVLKTADAIEQLVADINVVRKERDALRNELCLRCGEYTEAHNGACDGCRWRVNR